MVPAGPAAVTLKWLAGMAYQRPPAGPEPPAGGLRPAVSEEQERKPPAPQLVGLGRPQMPAATWNPPSPSPLERAT